MTAGPITDCSCGVTHPKGCSGHVDLEDGTRRPCQLPPMRGGRVCRSHGGAAPQVRAAAARRLAEAEAAKSIADVVVGPIENPLDALARIAAEAVALKDHFANVVAQLKDQYRFTDDRKQEQLDARVGLYERALDRAHKFLTDWVRLGFEERKARLDDARAQLVATALRGVFTELRCPNCGFGFDPESEHVLGALDRWMPILDGALPPAPIEVHEADDQEDDDG